MEAMDFVEKSSSYLEKASHSIEKKTFCSTEWGGPAPPMEFQGGWKMQVSYQLEHFKQVSIKDTNVKDPTMTLHMVRVLQRW